MKKILSFLLVLTLVLSLSACGKSEAAKTVDDQIAAIGDVTLDSEASIAAAEEAVAALPEADKKQLGNLGALEEARSTYESLVLDAAATQIEDAISAIGTVTLDSGEAISAAAAAYDGAAAEVQALVENAAALDEARTALAALQVTQVTEMIDAIGTVTLDSGEAIKAAREVYNALPDENKAKVANAAALDAAAEQLKTLQQQQAESLLANMRKDEDKVQNVQFYSPKALKYYSNGSWAADLRSFVLPYLGRNDNSVWVRMICNYTSSDWVFFEKIIFAVDDERYTKTFGPFDTVRDNDGGRIWEYVDIEVSSWDIDMLWEIANSTETIVRFEGDDYYDDFTVSAADKQAIREVLTAYEALSA